MPAFGGGNTGGELDGNVVSLFSRTRISHGRNVVEDTQQCGRLWHVLNDIQKVNDARGKCILLLDVGISIRIISVGFYVELSARQRRI